MYLLIIARLSSHHSIPRGSISVLSRAKKWVPMWTDLRRSFWVSLTVGSSLYQWSCGLEQIYELAAFFISVFFQYFGKRKSMPETFLCSTKEVSAHNLGCPVVSRVTFFEVFSSTVCSLCAILDDVIVICATAIMHLVVFALVWVS